MRKFDSNYLFAPLLVLAFIAAIIICGLVDIKKQNELQNIERSKCEGAGGWFYSGDYGANNCVFPPKE